MFESGSIVKHFSIWMSSGTSFSAYFDDDDLFFGHSITVCGSPKKGLVSADIEG